MATKKQKREAGLAKREKFLETVRLEGLKAQQLDHLRKERKNYQKWEEKHNKSHGPREREEACPWCRDIQEDGPDETPEDDDAIVLSREEPKEN